MKKIPYGISDFKALREQGYLYVDKTQFIEKLENLGEKYIFFLRPRRFGKSLFISLLHHYYDKNAESYYDTIFPGTYIYDHPTPGKNAYYVLNFNFSGINTSTQERCLEGFAEKIILGLKKFESYYNLKLAYKTTGLPSDILGSFLVETSAHLQGKIYVLIDEYDHFANELLSFKTEIFEDVISKTGFVRKWFEVLKEGTETIIDRIFATGVTPVTLDSLTSGFNIARNKSRDQQFNECLGFTEEEVLFLFNELFGENFANDSLLPILKNYYNGYLFCEYSHTRLFNSDMVLYYLSEYILYNRPPSDMIDSNISSDYSKIQNLFNLKNKSQNLSVLEELVNQSQTLCTITREFSFAVNFSSDDFKSLLFYMGLLTIKEAARPLILGFPNYVMKELYFDYFGKLIKDQTEFQLETSALQAAIFQIADQGKIDLFITIIENILERLSKRDYIKFDEKYVKVIIFTLFMMSKIYYVKSEYEVEGGFIDIALLRRVNVPVTYPAIFEIKYIKKSDSDTNPELQAQKMQEAKAQILKYTTAEELKSEKNLKKFCIVVTGHQCQVEEIVN